MALLTGSLLAGCIGDGSETDDLGAQARTLDELVDAGAALEAGEQMANIEVLGAFRDGFGQEAEAWRDLLFVDQGSEVVILNVSDPAAIEEVSRIAFPAVVDVKVSADGRWMFTVEDAEYSEGHPLAGTSPFIGGLTITDISDPANPKVVTFVPVGLTRGPHMVTYTVYPDGREVLFLAAGEQVAIASFDRDAGTAEVIARYRPGPLAQNPDPRVIDPWYGARSWVHDMFAQIEDDGTVLLYVAAWDAGLHVVDVTSPDAPELLGAWNEFAAEEEEGNLHTVVTEWIGDRRITVGSVEVGFLIVGGYHYALGQDLSVLYVWDTTDAADPTLLGKWVNPVKPYSGRNAYVLGPLPGERIESSHNIQVENGRIYLAHYDLGTWVLDISTPAHQADPAILAYHFDEQEGEVWDVVVQDGAMFTSGDAGVVALHFLGDALGPGGVTSRA